MDNTIPDSAPQKQCTKCKQFFPATTEYFHKSNAPDGLKYQCKTCRNAETKRIRRGGNPRKSIPSGYKRCGHCKQIKPATREYFSPAKRFSYGLASWCKECTNKRGREYKAAKRKPIDLPPPGFKRCTACHNDLPATTEHFNIRRDTKSGLGYRCRSCSKAIQHARYIPHPRPKAPDGYKQCTSCKEIKPATHQYFASARTGAYGLRSHCKSCTKKESQLYQREHRGQRREYERKYERVNRERIRSRRLNYKERIREYQRRYERVHRERIAQRRRTHRKNHRELYNTSLRNLRALRRAVPGEHTALQIQEQLKRQRYRCYYCTNKFQRVRKNGEWKYTYQVEHTFPLSRVSGDIPANDMSYLVLACPTCNRRKGNKYPHEWPEGGRLM